MSEEEKALRALAQDHFHNCPQLAIRMNKETSNKPILFFESVDLARTFSEWKSPLLSTEFLFIQTFKDLILANKKLLEKEREFEFFNTEMRNKWEKLKSKQAEFISNIQKYDSFFIENEEKSNRILHKIQSKLEKQEKSNDDIVSCEKRIQCLTKAESQLEKSLERLTPYRNCLEKIVEKMDGFKCSMELINYYVLMNSEIQQLETLHQSMSNTEKKRMLIVSCLKNKMQFCQAQNNIIFYSHKTKNNKIKSKQELDIEKQNQWLSTQNIMAGVLTVKHSCNNIFLRLIKWKKRKFLRKMDDQKKSGFITETLNELQDALDSAHQLYNKKDTSSQADSSFLTSRRMI